MALLNVALSNAALSNAALSNVAIYAFNRILVHYYNRTTHISPNTMIHLYNTIYPNNNYSLFSPHPEEENYNHISFASPESDFTAERFEILIQLLKENGAYYSNFKGNKK